MVDGLFYLSAQVSTLSEWSASCKNDNIWYSNHTIQKKRYIKFI